MSPDELSRNLPVRMHWFGLWFRPVAVERDYRLETVGLQRVQARLALVTGVLLYLLHGLVDVWFHGDHQPFFWVVRALVTAAGLTALVYTFLPSFTRLSQRVLTLVSLAPSLGILFMLAFLSGTTFMEYLAGLMLVMIWIFLFIGLSFVRALLINLLVLVLFNGLFLAGIQPLGEILVRYNFYLVSTLLICGFSAYALERQRRQLYLRRQELESERNRHRDRALHDHLTNLPNRYQMEQRLEQAMARARRHGRLGAGLFIDLDRFKPVNDSYGHEAGDRVLRQVAQRLQACVRESDSVARMGGDEFFVLLEDLETSERIHEVALRIIEALSQPFPIDEQDPQSPLVTVGASIGICEFPDMTASPPEVIDHADRAMYEVKRSGRNGYCFHRATGPGEVIHPRGAQTAQLPVA
ncbi:diguanylate cyclase [Thioalkalivibrio sulfidiphilus HL-EbGr7]|uniref:Diguanylate cyclase n=1 Tax=Thioalkalivibrio sulfidiphilus (strain HL-EbGR7) TaxID=396588 RepID=B8GL77_THISH|nr:diguanylate cyclase [Thioalkalivibrio sulfidiphilus]ACL71595.1 diguanylate cyclase [Thioalkalivibrio sulfidiphilus HL-EbGr7]